MSYHEDVFGKQGLVIPLFSNMGMLDQACLELNSSIGPNDKRIEEILSQIYTPMHLAAMVRNRYPFVPYIKDYHISISEAVEAHFLGLGHIAVAGIIPIVEGAGRQLAFSKGIKEKHVIDLFTRLTGECIDEVISKKIGAFNEIESLLNSFLTFLKFHFYKNTNQYTLSDKTNRHGILHGLYSDKNYGTHLNFYKVVSILDMLCLISTYQVFPAKNTPESQALSLFYITLVKLTSVRRQLYKNNDSIL